MMPREDIELVEDLLNQQECYDLLINKMKKDFKGKSPEELSQELEEFLTDVECYGDLVKAIPDLKLVLDKLETLSDDEKFTLLSNIPQEYLIKYINDKGQASDEILVFLANPNYHMFDSTSQFLEFRTNTMESLDSDLNRAKILLFGGDITFLPYIQDLYYRNQIVKAKSEFNFSTEDLLGEIEIYNAHLKKLSEIEDENARAEYISTIEDNDMKQALLETLEEKDNRMLVIESFLREVDPEIASLDELVRTMITEFFEDRLGENYTDEKRERLQNVFARTDVCFEELYQTENGKANHVLKRTSISNKHKNSINRNIGFLIHEYAHHFSFFDYSYTADGTCTDIEEGMADTFSDLVVNHYLSRHKYVILDGKKVRIDSPYFTYSGYDTENAWARTMLAGLESKGRDIDAMAEYLLGNKNKFAEMIWGRETAESKNCTKFGETLIYTNVSELYYSKTLDFSNIDENSIYYRRNCILPFYQIQKRIGGKEDLVSAALTGNRYLASDIANQYFNGKKFYELPEAEFERFMRLIDGQLEQNGGLGIIIDIDIWKNEIINTLTDQEIKEFSFEILERISAIWGKTINAGTNLERVMRLALEEETRKIAEGQSIDISRAKRNVIMERYAECFTENSESNMYINDYINDFCFEVSQAEQSQKAGNKTILGMVAKVIRSFARTEGVPEEKVNARNALNTLGRNLFNKGKEEK